MKDNGVNIDSWNKDEEEEENTEEEYDDPPREKTGSGTRLLTSIQIIGCMAILAAALFLRFSGGKFYGPVRDWYIGALNDSVVAEEQLDQAKHTVIGLWTSLSSAGPKNLQGAQSSLGAASGVTSGSESHADASAGSAGANSAAQVSP